MKALFFVIAAFVANMAHGSDTLRIKRLHDSWSFQTGMLVKRPEMFATSSLSYMLTRARNPRLHAGVTLGFDHYSGWHTVPLSFTMRWDGRSKNPWFVQGSAGRAWARMLPDFRTPNYREDWGGPAYYIGLGKAIRYGNIEVAWLVGYRIQQVGWRDEVIYDPQIFGRDRGPVTEVDQTFRRLSLTLQVSWR
jgi:hypothetical protein